MVALTSVAQPRGDCRKRKGFEMAGLGGVEADRRRLLCRLLVAAPLVVAVGAHAAGPAAPVKGLDFTISGPAFSAPARFVVSADAVKLTTLLHAGNFTMMAVLNPPVTSVDGKHRLSTFALATEPAGVGTYTETSGLSSMSFALTTDAGTPSQQAFSVSFRYSRGTTLPARIAIERYEPGRLAVGVFSGQAQRTNPKRKDQIYEISGRFDVRD